MKMQHKDRLESGPDNEAGQAFDPAEDAQAQAAGGDLSIPAPIADALRPHPLSLQHRIVLLVLGTALGAAALGAVMARQDTDPASAILVLITVLLLGAALAMHQARIILRPVRLMTQRSAQLAARHFGEVPGKSVEDFTALARSIDSMSAALLRQTQATRKMYLSEVQNGLELQRQYALMQLLRNLASAANNGETLERALQSSLWEIGSYLDWPVGRLVLVVRDGEIEDVRSHWYAPGQGRFASFLEASNATPWDGEGDELIGRARQSNLSHWVTDLGGLKDWPRRESALACGLRTGFVIPIAAEGDSRAFVEFFSDHRIEASAEMLELVEAISLELWSTANRYQVQDAAFGASSGRARRLASIAECMEGAIAVASADGRVEWVNAGLTRLIGCPASKCLGRDIPELLFGSDPASAEECRRYLASGEPVTACVLTARSGESGPRWFELEIQPMPDDRAAPAGLFVIVRDITRDRETHRALIDALETARQASQSKSQFLANMSHEIRTPMNGVLGMAELLLGTRLDERQRRFIESLYRSGEALLDIINDILDFSKIEAGKLELETIDFDLRTLVEDLIELLAPRAHQKRVELAVKLAADLPDTVRGDPTRIRQVLINIIGNAIKFTERGEVVLTVESLGDAAAPGDGQRATRVAFQVRDTGIGMRQEAVERLFSVFMQADQSSSRRYGGTGLGLAISRQLTELMGGSISARSRIGEGSVFRVELPLQHGDSAAVAAAPGFLGSLAGRRVLIAEDNPTNRRILSEQLGALEMDCALAENGRQALQMLRVAAGSTSPFDVAVIDMKMPIMDGMELAQCVRADPVLHALPIVILTSLSGRDDARKAQAIGIDAFLSKPVRRQELINSLSAALQLQPHQSAAGATSGRLRDLDGRRVLVVEDNPVNQEVVSAMLAGFGCHARVAENGQAALAILEREEFDAILMDCQMPTMDGFEAMRRIRDPDYRQHDLERARATPVIALTANALSGDAERCRAAGFSDYLAKTFRERDLGEMLLRWTSRAPQTAAQGTAHDIVPAPQDGLDAAPRQPAPVRAIGAPDEGILESRVLDEIAGMERNGAQDLLGRLIETYENSTRALLRAADEGFARNDASAVADALHTLKSSSANVGALRFSRVCGEIHALVRARRLADARARWQGVHEDHGRVLAALRELRPAPERGASAPLAETAS